MDVGEPVGVALASLTEEYEALCPFNEDGKGGPKKEDEDIADDDKDSVQEAQKNDGGILGKNLEKGSAGKADGGPYQPGKSLYRNQANDSYHGRKSKLKLKAYEDIDAADFPFSAAAHHLIPGNATLYNTDLVELFNYMEKGKEVKSLSGRTYTINNNIGYDINGAHNGVWLPGNYAIRKARPGYSYFRKSDGKEIKVKAKEGTTPVEGLSWCDLGADHEPWQFDYVAGTCKVAKGQFHDSHERPYSENVRIFLNKISTALAVHQDGCQICKEEGKKEIPPPYRIKQRLYAISRSLRLYVTLLPQGWKRPWFTSEKWCKKFFSGGKISDDFLQAYRGATESPLKQ